jgi:hypothetical protein
MITVETAKSKVCNALIDTMGSYSVTFVERVEKAKEFQELKELLVSIASVVEAFGGRSALQSFIQRVGKISE